MAEPTTTGDKPVPHPLTPEANLPPKPGEISYPENQEVVAEQDRT